MKHLILWLLMVSEIYTKSEHEKWQQFQMSRGKNQHLDGDAVEIFLESLRRFQSYNLVYSNAKSPNKFVIDNFKLDTKQESVSIPDINTSNELNIEYNKTFSHIRTEDLPLHVDWREKGVIGKVMHQGDHCGACWSINAVASIEAQIINKTGYKKPLSIQNLLDCADEKYGNYGCVGGLPQNAFKYILEKGVLYASDYQPYDETDHRGQCKQRRNGIRIKGYFTVARTEEALLKAVATHGPITVCIDAKHMNNYHSGIIRNNLGCNTSYDGVTHAALLIGYGTDNGVPYWLLKNSWGTKWGENGYFRLLRDGSNTCGITQIASAPYI